MLSKGEIRYYWEPVESNCEDGTQDDDIVVTLKDDGTFEVDYRDDGGVESC